MKKIIALTFAILMLASVSVVAHAYDPAECDGHGDYSVSPTALYVCPSDSSHRGFTYTENSNGGHTVGCRQCFAIISLNESHSLSPSVATCQQPQTCIFCDYVSLGDHNWGAYSSYGHNTHRQYCTNDGCFEYKESAHYYGPAYYLTYRNLTEDNDIWHDIWMDCVDCGYEYYVCDYRCLEQSMSCDGHCNY